MNLVAGEAGHGRLFCELRLHQAPWAFGIDWSDEIADASLEVHGMTTQAIVDQYLLPVLFFVQKDLGIGGAVLAGMPVGKFLLVAALAANGHRRDVFIFEAWFFGNISAEMGEHTSHVVEVEPGVKREHIAVAVGAGNVAVSGGMPIGVRLPDFVTARARAPLPTFVVNGGSDDDQSCDDEQGQRRGQPAAE
jgi:hypothetical protein